MCKGELISPVSRSGCGGEDGHEIIILGRRESLCVCVCVCVCVSMCACMCVSKK